MCEEIVSPLLQPCFFCSQAHSWLWGGGGGSLCPGGGSIAQLQRCVWHLLPEALSCRAHWPVDKALAKEGNDREVGLGLTAGSRQGQLMDHRLSYHSRR